jgi:hypothetical protein
MARLVPCLFGARGWAPNNLTRREKLPNTEVRAALSAAPVFHLHKDIDQTWRHLTVKSQREAFAEQGSGQTVKGPAEHEEGISVVTDRDCESGSGKGGNLNWASGSLFAGYHRPLGLPSAAGPKPVE